MSEKEYLYLRWNCFDSAGSYLNASAIRSSAASAVTIAETVVAIHWLEATLLLTQQQRRMIAGLRSWLSRPWLQLSSPLKSSLLCHSSRTTGYHYLSCCPSHRQHYWEQYLTSVSQLIKRDRCPHWLPYWLKWSLAASTRPIECAMVLHCSISASI